MNILEESGLWAVTKDGFIQCDLNTGQLEVYETKHEAQINARQGHSVREVSVEQVIDCGGVKSLGDL